MQAYEVSEYGNMGYTALAITYIVFSVGNLFASAVVVRLGPRLSIIVAAAFNVAWAASNIDAFWFTLIPTSFLQGMGGSLLWTSEGSLLAACSTPQTLGMNNGIVGCHSRIIRLIGCLAGASSMRPTAVVRSLAIWWPVS